jgi:hyperosmotically inducible periplasmic protein
MPDRPTRRIAGALAVAASLALLAPLAACTADRSGSTAEAEPLTGDAQGGGDPATALTELKIRAALLEHLKLDGLGIGIHVADRTATLTGEVDEAASKTVAEEVALTVEGVDDVHNRITVKSEESAQQTPVARVVGKAERGVDNALLETRVKSRLIEELGKVAFQVEVEASDKTVVLRGTVPDDSRRELAVKTAQQTSGVDKVHDLITVTEG